jgi:hypothetical protein
MADILSNLTSGITDAFKGIAPPNVNTTQTTQTTAPAPYMGFLNTLGTQGLNALNPNQTLQGNIEAGQPYIAPLTQLQKDIYGTSEGQANTEKLLTAGIAPFSSAISTAGTASTPIGASQINAFLNPYVSDVNKNLETATQQNINQSILPSLQAIGASTGGTGSQRLLNATGQALGGIQQGLSAQESANLAQAYKDAVSQSLQQQQNLGQIAGVQGQLGTGLESATVQGLNAGANLGAQGQAQTQAQINAPLTTASNVASLLKGYTIPTGTTQTYSGPASSYGASPLSQIAGLATLFGSTGTNGISPVAGIYKALTGNDLSGSGGLIPAIKSWMTPDLTVDANGIPLGSTDSTSGVGSVDTSQYGGAYGPSIR